ncbi:MAG: LCP family protein [Actinomycetaceae bacterium]|nr:LCP family protein [Actinomycetaceae bacterium]
MSAAYELQSAEDPKPSTAKRALKVLLIVALLMVVALGAFVFWLHATTIGQIETVPEVFPEETSRPAAEPESTAVNVLILGSDSRISAGDPSQWEAGAQRTDTMMLAQFSKKNNTVSFMSIPRDSWVNIPGYGEAKINAAYSYGGPKLTIQTVEELTGVRIDHFALVDFTTFTRLTDQLGGVTIATVDGEKTMGGEEALRFVRERYSLAGGDFDRVKRQQAWVRAVISKALSREVLTSPTTALELLETVSADMATDADLTTVKMVNYAFEARGIRPQNITFMTSPSSGTGTSADGQSIVVVDHSRLDPLMKAWKTDDLAQYMEKHGSEITGLPQVVD